MKNVQFLLLFNISQTQKIEGKNFSIFGILKTFRYGKMEQFCHIFSNVNNFSILTSFLNKPVKVEVNLEFMKLETVSIIYKYKLKLAFLKTFSSSDSAAKMILIFSLLFQSGRKLSTVDLLLLNMQAMFYNFS